MQSLFCVHWVTVYEALSWLKIHNPKYYECVQIDGTQLSKFSDNDVPIEILGSFIKLMMWQLLNRKQKTMCHSLEMVNI